MTDIYLVAGDLETLHERVGYVVEDLGPVVVDEVGSYIHGGCPEGRARIWAFRPRTPLMKELAASFLVCPISA